MKHNTQSVPLLVAALSTTAALLVVLCLLLQPHPAAAGPPVAEPLALTAAVTEVSPASAPNDLDTALIITGTGFVSPPAVTLGNTALNEVGWVSSTRLTATVPWGLAPGTYTVTVTNPGGASTSLAGAFTVEEGLGVWNVGQLYGGSIGELVLDPATPDTLYAVSEEVGLFRSGDGAGHWSFIASGNATKHLAVVPTDPDTLYVSMIGQASHGLHRSDDSGDTWTALNAPGSRAFPHPTNPDVVYVAQAGDNSGLWRSENRGLAWTAIITGLTDTQVNVLAFDPTDPLTMYAGTEKGRLFVSTNGGDAWFFIAQPTDHIQTLAVNPRGDHELWVSNCCFCTPKETLKSTNADHTAWAAVADPVGSSSATTIAVPPAAWGSDAYTDTVFVNGCWGEAYRTDDGGASWSQFGPQTGEWALALHPTNPDIAYRSSVSDGVIKTVDQGGSWQVVNEGLTAVVPDHLAAVPDQPDTLFALSGRDGGLYKGTRGGEAWQFLTIPGLGGSLSAIQVDPVTPTRVYGGGSGQEHVTLYISEDGGATWPATAAITITDPYTTCENWITAIAADVAQPGTLLLGVEHFCMGVPGVHDGDLYYSTDAGLSWTLAEINATDTISPVTAIVHDAQDANIVYASTGIWDMGSGLLRSTDGGQTWTRIGADVPALDFVLDLAAQKRDPYTIFALTNHPGGLYVSEDQGLTWAPAGNPLSGFFIEDILCTDEEPSWLYAAVSQSGWGPGLYRSKDGAQSWERVPGEVGRVPVCSLATATNDGRVFVYAGTTGGALPVEDAVRVQSGALSVQTAAAAQTLVNAGVYRHTGLAPAEVWPYGPRIYLPLTIRAGTP